MEKIKNKPTEKLKKLRYILCNKIDTIEIISFTQNDLVILIK